MELTNKLLAALSECTEALYVIDEERRTMLYANEALQAEKGADYEGRPCYEYLCGRSQPCGFCPELSLGDPVYDWEYYESDRQSCRLVKNRLVEENGCLYRVGNANLVQTLMSLSRETAGEIHSLHELIAQNEQRKYALEWGAFHDRMTRLYNRARFIKDSAELYVAGVPIGLAYFDINDLKLTNDRFGHQAGDRLILTVSGILELTMSRTVRVYRMGGDEFLTVLTDADTQAVDAYIDAFRSELDEQNRRDGTDYAVAAGGVCGVLGPGGIDALLKQADERMYEAKKEMKRTAANQ